MSSRVYQIDVNWDDEARVWVAECLELPGLLTEAETVEAMIEKLKVMVPEMVGILHEEVGADALIPFRVRASRVDYAAAH